MIMTRNPDKHNIKFLLALGNAKMVMLQNTSGSSFYTRSNDVPHIKKTDLKRIAALLENS